MRAAIETALHDLGSASAKAIAAHAGLEDQDTLKELIAMVDEGAAHREKRNGNEYWYWLDETYAAIPRLGQPAALPEEPARLDDQEPQATSAQPASGAMNNPGSSGSAPPNGTPSAGAAASIHQERAEELKAALDEIDRLKAQLAVARHQALPENWLAGDMLTELQTYLEDGIFLIIGEKYAQVGWADNVFDLAENSEMTEVVGWCVELERRLVA